ncbi:MAG: hypothetical protein U5Q44_13095 [Dehalococcoidia bacterium]|nr:hypothetical protein [Dehalococcoidia bacterium]
METKRFIGNDMPRLYARIRRDIGPDAIIVRTRSLLREGADPLIEILAAPDDGSGLPSELQHAMHNSVLGRVDPSMTVGDLEDIITREARATGGYAYEEPPLEDEVDPDDFGAEDEPAWSPPASEDSLEAAAGPDGFNEAQLLDQLAAELEKRAAGNPDLAVPPAFQQSDEGTLPAFHAATRPESPAPRPGAPRPGEDGEPAAPRLESVERESPLLQGLQEAGFSRYAAECVVELASPGASPEYAVAQALTAGRTDYPAEDETAVISVQGSPGSGRTTALLRMALDCHAAGRDVVICLAGDPPGGGYGIHPPLRALGRHRLPGSWRQR